MAVILEESLRAVFHAPFYVALARDGTVDVCWGGPMRQRDATRSSGAGS